MLEVINLVSSDEDEDEDEGRMRELERILSSSQEKAAYGRCVSRLSLRPYRTDMR